MGIINYVACSTSVACLSVAYNRMFWWNIEPFILQRKSSYNVGLPRYYTANVLIVLRRLYNDFDVFIDDFN